MLRGGVCNLYHVGGNRSRRLRDEKHDEVWTGTGILYADRKAHPVSPNSALGYWIRPWEESLKRHAGRMRVTKWVAQLSLQQPNSILGSPTARLLTWLGFGNTWCVFICEWGYGDRSTFRATITQWEVSARTLILSSHFFRPRRPEVRVSKLLNHEEHIWDPIQVVSAKMSAF